MLACAYMFSYAVSCDQKILIIITYYIRRYIHLEEAREGAQENMAGVHFKRHIGN